MDDDRQPEADDFFEFEGHDVTDQGLGEAARRNRVWDPSGVFSFMTDEIDFERSPLSVQHGLREEPFGRIDVPNVWRVGDFEAQVLDGLPDPTNWQELIDFCRASFDRLLIPDSILDRLAGETFYPNVAKRTIELFKVLQAVMEGRNNTGKLTDAARELWQTHSQGDKAWFSDESPRNKEQFGSELTFEDPDNVAKTLFCGWHGKIKTPQFRIHFEWPVPVGQLKLKVVYIGPKITKA